MKGRVRLRVGRSRGRAGLAAALLVGVAALAGCTSGVGVDGPIPTIAPARIAVDTPTLRRDKLAAGIATCRPGSGGNQLPKVTLPCFGGGPSVALDRLRGPLVINLWQSSCGPCRVELPIYEQLSRRLAGRVSVLGVDFNDAQSGAAMDLLTQKGVTYPQVADPQELLRTAHPRIPTIAMPVLLLVDTQGKVVFSAPTAIRSYAQLAELISTHLGISA